MAPVLNKVAPCTEHRSKRRRFGPFLRCMAALCARRYFGIHHVRVMGYEGAGQHGREDAPLSWREVGSHESADTARDIDLGCMRSVVPGWLV